MLYGYHKRCLKLCAVVDLVIAIFYWVGITLYLWKESDFFNNLRNGIFQITIGDIIPLFVLLITFACGFLEIYLFNLLRHGVENESYSECCIWISIRFVFFVFGLAARALYLTAQFTDLKFFYWDIFVWSIALYSWYELGVGYSYVKYLKAILPVPVSVARPEVWNTEASKM